MNPAGVGGMASQLFGETTSTPVNFMMSVEALANSAILGIVLMAITVWANNRINVDKSTLPTERLSPADLIINSANVLFICFGMTGMLLLVNNNIARAFAIAAAIALVRFKIKVDSKIMSMSLFYAVLTGMACGVGYSFIGYILVLFFGVLQLVVMFAVKAANKKSAALISNTQSSVQNSETSLNPAIATAAFASTLLPNNHSPNPVVQDSIQDTI